MILKRLPDLGFEVKVQNGPMPNWDAQMKMIQCSALIYRHGNK